MNHRLTMFVSVLALGVTIESFAQFSTNDEPQKQLRFKTAREADAKREQIVSFIWKEGLPLQSTPRVTKHLDEAAYGKHLAGVDLSLLSRVDKLETNVLGIDSLIYLMYPTKLAETATLGIVHAGHSSRGPLSEHYPRAIACLLKRGFVVAMIHMPQHGWNDDETAELANGKKVVIRLSGFRENHAAIVNLPQHDLSLPQGAGFQPFLEPVIACINYWARTHRGEPDVVMIGLSGGGWTTHMVAAIDRRIRLSVPVAGSYPLYLRNRDEKSEGDLEQVFHPLYDENVAGDGSGGGVATWLEIYALGGYGMHRRQVMITTPEDSCCFGGDPEETVNTFKDIVSRHVKQLGHGHWSHVLDTSHQSHTISHWAIEHVIEPLLDSASD